MPITKSVSKTAPARRRFKCLFSLVTIVILLLSCYHDSFSQWVERAPNVLGPQQHYQGAMTFHSGIAWAGTTAVWMSSDSGTTWTKRYTIPNAGEYITDIAFYDATNGVVATSDGLMYITSDQGVNWRPVDRFVGITGVAYLGSPQNIVISTGLLRQLEATTDGGITWTTVSIGEYAAGMKALLGGSAVAIAGDAAKGLTIYRTTDYGNSWQTENGFVDYDSYSFDVDPCAPNDIYIINEECITISNGKAEIFRSQDGGNTWTSLNAQVSNRYYSGSIVLTPQALFVQTISNGVLRSTDNGTTWKNIGGPSAGYDTRLLCAINPNIVLAADDNGSIWQTVNSGNDSISGLAPYGTLDISPLKLFLTDTLTNCDTPVIRQLLFSDNTCIREKVVSQSISGQDSDDYAIVQGIKDSLSGYDTVLLSFKPRGGGDRHSNYVIVLQDGTKIVVPLFGDGSNITFVQGLSASVSLDTIGGTANLPITINGLPKTEDLEFVVRYDPKLQYTGTYTKNGTRLDIPGDSLSGYSRIHLDANLLRLDTSTATAEFVVFPDYGDSCYTVTIDSLDILNPSALCLYSIGPGVPVTICPPKACGVGMLTNFLLHKISPHLSLYPDPVSRDMNIWSDKKINDATLTYFDALGRTVAMQQTDLNEGATRVILPDLISGVYRLQIEASFGKEMLPLLIEK